MREDVSFSKSKQFYRCLTMAFCEFCMINNNKDFDIDTKELKDKSPILVKFFDNSDEKKIDCLHAIYDLNLKINNPPSKSAALDKPFRCCCWLTMTNRPNVSLFLS